MNKFKVGDWVHCYLLNPPTNQFARYAIRIEKIEGNNRILYMSDGIRINDLVPAYYKMCRKLKKPPIKSYVQHVSLDGVWAKKCYAKAVHS